MALLKRMSYRSNLGRKTEKGGIKEAHVFFHEVRSLHVCLESVG